jgi:hypothetical protein
MRWTALRLLAILFALSSISVAYSAPRNLLIDRGRTEPVVATDPHNPSTLVLGANPNFGVPVNGVYPMPFFTSHDGGKTFHSGVVPLPSAYLSATDPSLAFASSGTIFYGFAAVHPGSSTCANCKCTETEKPHGAILVSRSVNGGKSFLAPAVVDTADEADRPSLAVESIAGHLSHVFMTWTRTQNDIWYARSTNGGVTFSRPARLYSSVYGDAPALPVVVSPHHIAVVWIETGGDNPDGTTTARIMVQSSTDDGKTFSPPTQIVGWMKSMPRQVEPGNLRTTPSLGVAAGPGGMLYAAWPEVRTINAGGSLSVDIDMSWSSDGGKTWHTPHAVNDVHTGDRFMPSLSVFPDGSVGMSFYDRRVGPNDLSVYAVHVSVHGGFHRSNNIPVSGHYANIAFIHQIPQSTACGSVSPGRFFGDYMGTSALNPRTLRVTWTDSGLGVADETDMWLAQVALPKVKG